MLSSCLIFKYVFQLIVCETPLLPLAQLPLVKLGRVPVCMHHYCICWQACLCLIPLCQQLHRAMSHPNIIPKHLHNVKTQFYCPQVFLSLDF